MAKIISAQRFLDDAIVAAKSQAKDYVVAASPKFSIDGEAYRVMLDGHHSLAAAQADGVEAEFVEQSQSDNDTIALLAAGYVDDFLLLNRIDSDYYDVATGKDVW